MTRGYGVGTVRGYTESILWLVKERPTAGEIAAMPLNRGEFSDWDQGDQVWAEPVRLETRIIYWYPLRIPFIDWVLSRIILAQWGLMAYTAQTPYMPVHNSATGASNWNTTTTNPMAGDAWQATVKGELVRRYGLGQYSFPIFASSRMRMMTPPRQRFFASPTCGFP
jgi:hypothetical protein